MTKLRNGAFVRTAVWSTLSSDDRRRLEAAATAEMHAGYMATHRSAAALWRVPTLRRHDGIVHARATVAAGTRTEHGIRKHAVHDVDLHLTRVDGITCTTIERTVLDLAATEPFSEAVVAADWALRNHDSKDRLRAALDEWSPARGRRRIESVFEFADGKSGSAGESLSRVEIAEGGLPASPGDVVADEKIREDRLRATATHPGVDRWVWAVLGVRGQLARRLIASGLPRVR